MAMFRSWAWSSAGPVTTTFGPMVVILMSGICRNTARSRSRCAAEHRALGVVGVVGDRMIETNPDRRRWGGRAWCRGVRERHGEGDRGGDGRDRGGQQARRNNSADRVATKSSKSCLARSSTGHLPPYPLRRRVAVAAMPAPLTFPLGQAACSWSRAGNPALEETDGPDDDRYVRGADPAVAQGAAAVRPARVGAAGADRSRQRVPLLQRGAGRGGAARRAAAAPRDAAAGHRGHRGEAGG